MTKKDLCGCLKPVLKSRGWVSGGDLWTSLEGGRTNWLWHVAGLSGDIVVKLFADTQGNPLFPNDASAEAEMLAHLYPHRIAPRLLDHFSTDFGACLVYAHAKGHAWRKDVILAAEALHRLHQIAPPNGLRRTPDGSQEIREQTLAILQRCSIDLAVQLRALEPKNHVAPSGFSHLLHGDPVPANMIFGADQQVLIDWQCPAIGDPCEDLSMFLSPAMQLTYRGEKLSPSEKSTFLSAYSDQNIVARYRTLAPWYHWRMAAYCLWKETQGTQQAEARLAEIAALEEWTEPVSTGT